MGAILLPAGCCRRGSPDHCSSCDDENDPTPVSLTVVFSGVTMCTACVTLGNDSYSFTITPSALSGSYSLTQKEGEGNCHYYYEEEATGTITHWDGVNCDSEIETHDIVLLRIEAMIQSNANLRLDAWWTTDSFAPSIAFSGDTPENNTCLAFDGINNLRASCNGITGVPHSFFGGQQDTRFLGAEDGSATVTPNF